MFHLCEILCFLGCVVDWNVAYTLRVQNIREEQLASFPPQLYEVQKIVHQKVIQSKYKDFIQAQIVLRKIASKGEFVLGFTIIGMSYKEESRRHQACCC